MANEIKLYGWKELAAVMDTLNLEMHTKIGNAAAGRAARILRDAAIDQAVSNGLVDTGSLVGNIAMVREKGDDLRYTYAVGVRHGGRKQIKEDDDPWYWFMHEFGTSRMPARPFITPMITSSAVQQEMLDGMKQMMEAGINRVTKAKAKKA